MIDSTNLTANLLFLGTDDEYEVGDLSGKYGTFLNLSSYTGIHVDYNLPLFGKNSIQGRSIVIHKMKTMGSARWVCADVFQVADGDNMFVMKTMINFTGPAVKGYVLLVSYFQYTAEPRSVHSPPESPYFVKSHHLSDTDNCGILS